MKFLTWNIQFWDRHKKDDSRRGKWKKLARELVQADFDFILLQESNPYIICDKNCKTGHKVMNFFEIGNKNIYYHELVNNLTQELYDPKKDIYWGITIIANKKYEMINKYSYNIPLKYLFDKTHKEYFGNETLRCYDFKIEKEYIITIVNLYNKCIYVKENDDSSTHKDYNRTLDNLIQGIYSLINNKSNFIILAGDFNVTKSDGYQYDKDKFIKKIENIGFINKTKYIGSTMLNYDNQNDYIFVNKKYSEYIDENDIKKLKCIDLSDHYGIKCKIKL
jgi:exonuclease III